MFSSVCACTLWPRSHLARVVHSTSYSDLTLRGRPTFGPYESNSDALFCPVKRNLYVRLGHDVDAMSFLHLRRIRTSWKHLYGPKVGRPLNVRGRLAEWVHPNEKAREKSSKTDMFCKTHLYENKVIYPLCSRKIYELLVYVNGP